MTRGRRPPRTSASCRTRTSPTRCSACRASTSAPPAATRAASTRTTASASAAPTPASRRPSINGHDVAAGDWFILDQTGTVGRSVSYTLLPSEIVSQMVVHKFRKRRWRKAASPARSTSSRAGPSNLKEQHTLQASVGAVYSDLPRQGRPAVQRAGQLEQRRAHLRRAGPGLLRERATCAATARNSWVTARSPRSATWRWPIRTWPACSTRTDRRGAVQAASQAQGRPAGRRVQAQRCAGHRRLGV